MERDDALDALLDHHGMVFVVEGNCQVRFIARRVPVSEHRPHGLNYSLTLHDANGMRLAGFDNAHAITRGSSPGSRRSATHDHRHRERQVKPYDYKDAATLLNDFWQLVEDVLKEKGYRS